ncbi:MAG: hypothetical protein GTN89_06300 [Acidobacteria bacterium]|nr:hypothetical protein [Acidobacteriota bacterium]NIM61742.1 hypothetical protein [Acidobacteriota bacterium]NIO58922.1 hypothetical protein [Acidobacteriota bacterium]NIQ29976.1 hypothetical protein [Acidobacteriota bacterium]NIQ84709.1 hypothetical protein [Acidobacteriota bacterium]
MGDSHDRPVFRVGQIDHVELFVPDRNEAADWYRRALGLTVCADYELWADDPKGPLMISSDGGSTKLALFEGRPQEDRETAGFHRVAFRVPARSFEAFLDRLDDLTLTDHRDRTVTRDLVQDHGRAVSIYFNDPYGHRIEITSYDVDEWKSLAPPEPAVEITDIEAVDEETDTVHDNEVMWLCHRCDAQITAERGVACSVCYRSTCPDCVGPSPAEQPVCKSCHEEAG